MIHQVKPLAYPNDSLEGISSKTLEVHHGKLYTGYVNKRNEIEEKLAAANKSKANATYSEYRELKLEEVFAADAQVLHELYFNGMAPEGKGKPNPQLLAKIEEDFGSMDSFMEDLKATGVSARGWAITAYDTQDQKLHNFLMDFHSHGAIWGAYPILVLDVYEHAYFIDYEGDKKSYIENWSKLINWEEANKLFTAINP